MSVYENKIIVIVIFIDIWNNGICLLIMYFYATRFCEHKKNVNGNKE